MPSFNKPEQHLLFFPI